MSELDATDAGTCDFWKQHFERNVQDSERLALASTERRRRELVTDGWAAADLRDGAQLQLTGGLEAEQALKVAAPDDLAEYGIKPRLQGRYREVAGCPANQPVRFVSRHEATFFALCNRYLDVFHTCLAYPHTPTLTPEESSTLLHAVHHVLRKMQLVRHNNERIRLGSLGSEDAQDQGFVRPVVLLLAPMRCVALRVVDRLLQLAQRETRVDSIQGKQRLQNEFGVADDVAATVDAKSAKRPAEHRALFENANTDDHFRMGIKVTRGAVKLFADLYESDIIVASPLGISTRLAENKEDGADFLASIELAVLFRADVMLMQNWAHVDTLWAQLNRLPKQQHGTDIMRVRPYALAEAAGAFRQTVVFSSFDFAALRALRSRCHNHEGCVTVSRCLRGVLDVAAPNAKQVFRRVSADDVADSAERRFNHFVGQVWPRLKEMDAPGTLLFASSYFEFVKLRGFLKTQGASLAVYSEYTSGANVQRARTRFAKGERKVLLYSERAHFFFRPFIRGVHTIVFYSLPEHPHFYSEVVGFLQQPPRGEPSSAVQALFTKFDLIALRRVVGDARAKRMVKDTAPSYLFM